VDIDFACKQRRDRYYQKINLKLKLYGELFVCTTFLEERRH